MFDRLEAVKYNGISFKYRVNQLNYVWHLVPGRYFNRSTVSEALRRRPVGHWAQGELIIRSRTPDAGVVLTEALVESRTTLSTRTNLRCF